MFEKLITDLRGWGLKRDLNPSASGRIIANQMYRKLLKLFERLASLFAGIPNIGLLSRRSSEMTLFRIAL